MEVLISTENHEFQILNQNLKITNWKILYAFCVGIIILSIKYLVAVMQNHLTFFNHKLN